jgi:hypothetical protein
MTTAEKLERGGFLRKESQVNFDKLVKAYDHIQTLDKVGLVFQGEVGTGKTMAMMALFFEDNYTIRLSNPLNIKKILPQKFVQDDEEVLEWGFENENVFLDDLGNEGYHNDYGKKTEAACDYITQFHFEYFLKGKQKGRFLATTNLTDAQLIERYGQRVFDRLLEMCCFVKFEGGTKRKSQEVF